MNIRTLQTAAVCLLGVTILGFWGIGFRPRVTTGVNDFVQLYAGAKLVGTPQLYDVEASQKIQMEAVGRFIDAVYYTRLPFYALVLKPLGALPYLTAYYIYQCVSLVVVGLFLWRFAKLVPETAILACMSPPLLVNFANGQDVGLTAAAAGFAYLLRLRNRPLLAGLVLSLGAIKFHLLILVPLVLLVRREWKMLQGGAVGAVALFGLSVIADGIGWPVRYLSAVSNPALHPAAGHMPTLRNLVWAICGEDNLSLEIALSAAVAAALAFSCLRSRSLSASLGFGLIGSLLVCHHAYTHDLTMLIPATALLIHGEAPKPARALAFLCSLPPVAFFIITGQPLSTVLVVAMFATVLSGMGLRAQERPATGDTETIPVGA
ncbi:MAG: glycosyltransferase family 87 protein [Bryobacteraceae bacterium]